MTRVSEMAGAYGRFIGSHPLTMAAVILVLTAVGFYGNSLIRTEVQDNSDMIPDKYEAIAALNFIGEEFGGTDSGTIVVEAYPGTADSSEVRDVRDPRVMEYLYLLARKAEKLEEVTFASSAAELVMEGGRLPKSQRVIRRKLGSQPYAGSYISDDYSMSLVRLDFIDGVIGQEFYPSLAQVVASTKAPPGVKTSLSGDFAVDVSLNRQMGPDMARTSQISMIGVLFVIIMLFRSLRYGLTSLSAIVFGVLWTFGLFGLLGIEVTNMTSGAASMIMGIGIDFGIQVSSRFRLEYRRKEIAEAMGKTISAVSVPMGTTTLAALIGFRAMSMGELKILGQLANMMSYGVLCCMLAALTVVPLALVGGEKIFGDKK